MKAIMIVVLTLCSGCATVGNYKPLAYCNPKASSHIHVAGTMEAPTVWTTYDKVCFDSNGMVAEGYVR